MNAAVKHAEAPSGWQAQLELEFAPRGDKTILSRRRQRGPLTTQRAFYPEGEVCHLYILHPPGGIVGGDALSLDVGVQGQARALLTAPGASKFYRSQGETAHQNQTFEIAPRGALEWLPPESIYFPGARARTHTLIKARTDTRFIAWEMHCLGLPANDKSFSTGQLQLDFSLFRDGRPVLLERLRVDAHRLDAPTGLRGRPVTALFIASPAHAALLARGRKVLCGTTRELFSATLVEDCLLVRYLGHSTAHCRQVFTRLWKMTRPDVLCREACPPRIWAT